MVWFSFVLNFGLLLEFKYLEDLGDFSIVIVDINFIKIRMN